MGMRANLCVALLGLLHVGLAAPLPPAFTKQFRCPFAKVWLEHGPERAAEMLGAAPHAGPGRQLGGDPVTNGTGGSGGGAPVRCLIAPGVVGAAHQLGYGAGYGSDCPGTPAQQSPYLWPSRWTAIVEAKNVGFQSDVVTYESRAKVWYALDKNWKRLDTFYQRGVQRDMGQLPCDQSHGQSLVNGSDFACNRSQSANTTMLHRNNRIVFMEWAANGSIASCSWLNAGVLGNIRPDWFMDDRGDSTGVQYLGDSLVYYLGEPRLVKQWRKKDFADQYHTMSMQRIPGADGIHWPLLLSVPGEGYGDDFLQHWHSHRLLNESDVSEFLLDEAYIRGGGSCPERALSRDVAAPTGQDTHVPGNLVVEPISWHESVYTASPVWTPPASPGAEGAGSAMTQEIVAGISATSCFDAATSSLRLSLALQTATPVWAAIGFRHTEECLMTPRGGGDGDIVYTAPDANDVYELYHGPLSPDVQRMQATAIKNFMRRMTPIRDVANFAGGSVEYSNGTLVLSFSRSYASLPAAFNLSFALGADRSFGYHSRRGCFTVAPVACPAVCLLAQGSEDARRPGGDARQQGGSDHSEPTSGARLLGPWRAAVLAWCLIAAQVAHP